MYADSNTTVFSVDKRWKWYDEIHNYGYDVRTNVQYTPKYIEGIEARFASRMILFVYKQTNK